MKFFEFRFWHLLAGLSGIIIAITMALASVSYNATLGTSEPAFRWLPFLSNSMVFSGLALAFDLGMVASVFGFLHWRNSTTLCCIKLLSGEYGTSTRPASSTRSVNVQSSSRHTANLVRFACLSKTSSTRWPSASTAETAGVLRSAFVRLDFRVSFSDM